VTLVSLYRERRRLHAIQTCGTVGVYVCSLLRAFSILSAPQPAPHVCLVSGAVRAHPSPEALASGDISIKYSYFKAESHLIEDQASLAAMVADIATWSRSGCSYDFRVSSFASEDDVGPLARLRCHRHLILNLWRISIESAPCCSAALTDMQPGFTSRTKCADSDCACVMFVSRPLQLGLVGLTSDYASFARPARPRMRLLDRLIWSPVSAGTASAFLLPPHAAPVPLASASGLVPLLPHSSQSPRGGDSGGPLIARLHLFLRPFSPFALLPFSSPTAPAAARIGRRSLGRDHSDFSSRCSFFSTSDASLFESGCRPISPRRCGSSLMRVQP